jgi:hypothetical protein
MTALAAQVDTRLLTAPRLPRTLADAGLSAELLEQLLVKTLYTGESTGHSLAERMRLPFAIVEPIIDRVRAERQLEVKGTSGTGAASFRYALTDLGQQRARQYLAINQYAGAAPVPLDRYAEQMRQFAATRGYIDRERMSGGFTNLIINRALFEQLGPAVNGNKAIFLYGPPGNGKSVIAEGIGQALGGEMYIPYAIEIDGQIITVYDPISHTALDSERDGSSVLAASARDRRWVRIRRPVVMVGGELTLDMLDLTFNPLAKYYEAPLQMKANGGVFLVDDFGRQRMRPDDLLNRWIVPLESRVDYLTLHTGKKFQMPFDVLIVFATNLDPRKLADEAFLRRIPYKIPVTDPSFDEFSQIFELNCSQRQLPYHPVTVSYLHRRHYVEQNRPLRACHPRDLLDQVIAMCRYRGIEPTVTRELLDDACASYFVEP